ncbi:UNVERIFIED_CONTAM: hypothetical protein NCL1_43090 [Trichonephila clavipes]
MDHVILNHGQVTWTTPELAPPSTQHTDGRTFELSTKIRCMVPLYGVSLMLKAFYVDLLLPLESNLEKDTKVVAGEHKRFLQQHKSHHDSYQKALSMCKKQKKRTRCSLLTIGKDVKVNTFS